MSSTRLTFISHACIALEGDFGKLVTDPWILNEPVYAFTTWKFPPAVLQPEIVAKDVRYLFISHAHEDHLHVPSLDYFSRDVTVLLPSYTNQFNLRAFTIERTLREMGFHRVRPISPWETVALADRTHLTLVPPTKLKWWDWENAGFVLKDGDTTIINMNDCPADAEIYKEVDSRFGPIDLGLIQYSGVSMFPGCYRMSSDEMRAAASKRRISWTQQKVFLEHLRLRRVAPFAGDFAWLDDRLVHCNWANRATPSLFENFVRENYPDKNIEVLIMYPSDSWSPQMGLTRKHPEVDWGRYLENIEELRQKLAPKVRAIRQWIDSSDTSNLLARTKLFIEYINRWIFQRDVSFRVRVRVVIEGPNSNLAFLMRASPDAGFRLVWADDEAVDQTLYIREQLWAAVLEGKVLLNNIQWAAENEQHVEFRLEIAHFWFWFEYHIDLNNRNPQALIDRVLHPQVGERIRPRHGTFPMLDEWEIVAQAGRHRTAA